MSSNRVAVIGAGWSGLAAAVELSTASIPVTVFESARQPGGRARRVESLGQPLDNGPHLLIGAYRETLGLMERVGVSLDRSLLRLPLQIVHPGRFRLKLPAWPAPAHLLAGILSVQGAGWSDRFKALRWLRHLQKNGYRLPKDETLSDLLCRYGQDGQTSQLGRYLWEPLCLAALNTPAERASAQVFTHVLRDSLGGPTGATDLLIPRIDLSALFPDPACRYIERHHGTIRMATRVTHLEPVPNGTALPQIRIGDETFAAAIVATNAPHAATLLMSCQDERLNPVIDLLGKIDYEPLASVYVRLQSSAALPAPLIGLPGPTGQWLFDLEQCGRAPGTISFVLSGSGTWDRLPRETLPATLIDELSTVLGRSMPANPDAIEHAVIREHRGTFSCRPGLIRPPVATPCPALFLAGEQGCVDYPGTLEGAVRSGIDAARHCLKWIGRSQTSGLG